MELKSVEFREELRALINRYSIENSCDTPDYILADYVIQCLSSFADTVRFREIWYGRDLTWNHSTKVVKQGE